MMLRLGGGEGEMVLIRKILRHQGCTTLMASNEGGVDNAKMGGGTGGDDTKILRHQGCTTLMASIFATLNGFHFLKKSQNMGSIFCKISAYL